MQVSKFASRVCEVLRGLRISDAVVYSRASNGSAAGLGQIFV